MTKVIGVVDSSPERLMSLEACHTGKLLHCDPLYPSAMSMQQDIPSAGYCCVGGGTAQSNYEYLFGR